MDNRSALSGGRICGERGWTACKVRVLVVFQELRFSIVLELWTLQERLTEVDCKRSMLTIQLMVKAGNTIHWL
jgi:hypothetical protein